MIKWIKIVFTSLMILISFTTNAYGHSDSANGFGHAIQHLMTISSHYWLGIIVGVFLVAALLGVRGIRRRVSL